MFLFGEDTSFLYKGNSLYFVYSRGAAVCLLMLIFYIAFQNCGLLFYVRVSCILFPRKDSLKTVKRMVFL